MERSGGGTRLDGTLDESTHQQPRHQSRCQGAYALQKEHKANSHEAGDNLTHCPNIQFTQ